MSRPTRIPGPDAGGDRTPASVEQGIATRRATGAAGLAAVVLFGVGNALWAFGQPGAGASPAAVVSFYAGASGRIIAGASLSLCALSALVFFACGVRAMLREIAGEDILPMAALAGGLLLAGAGLGGETINMLGALRAGEGRLTPALGQAVFEISYVLGYNAAGVGIATLMLAVATVALRARALMQRPLAVALVVVAVAFLTPLSRVLLAPTVLLAGAVSLQLLRTSPMPRAARPPDPSRPAKTTR